MIKERLQTVYDYLINNTPVNFSLNYFLNYPAETSVVGLQEILKSKDISCGTTACVCGLFPFIFPEDFEYVVSWSGLIRAQDKSSGFPVWFSSPTYLDLTSDEWDYLFAPSSYPESETDNPLAVAARIKTFIEENE